MPISEPTPNAAIISLARLHMAFGGVRAISDVSFDVYRNEVLAIIGPNGAGKTTLFNCISGLYVPTSGRISLQPDAARSVVTNRLTPDKITRLGVCRTFQNSRVFSELTVLENVMIGSHSRTEAGILGAILRTRRVREEESRVIDEAYEILKTVGLAPRVNELAKNLPYAEKRRLEIARALATAPKVLLLDEPAAGMNPNETQQLATLLNQLRAQYDIAMVLIEHDMNFVMSISQRIVVIHHGEKIAEGTPAQIRENPAVIAAYLGTDEDD